MTTWTPDLSPHAGPRYRAIADALAADIASRRLPPGTRLPTHRELAYHLRVTVGTVTRAYAEAERRGLIGGEVGRGTFVKGMSAAPLPMPEIREGMRSDGAGPVDLSVNQPHVAGFGPVMAEALAGLAAQADLETLLSYQPHAGMPAHREAGAAWLARGGVRTTPERVVVTSGGQNGMALAMLAAAGQGDAVLTEELTYPGIKVLAGTFGIRLQPVTIDARGIVPEAFEAACRLHRPRALYTMPNLHNPTLATMPEDRRRRIASIAGEYGVTLIEDDVFGHLLEERPVPLASLAPEITLHVASLSKILAPGLRLGYLSAPAPFAARIEQVVRAFSWMTPPLGGELARRWIEDGTADRMAAERRREAAARCALARGILGTAAMDVPPETAAHVWLRLPEPWRREEFAAAAHGQGVKVTLADAFVVGRAPAPHAVRVSLTAPPLREDVERSLRVLADLLSRPDPLMLSVV
jgi:DNA-binding transcriptional MocR family regulator